MQNTEYDIEFTDLTMIEANGEFEKVNKIMSKEFPFSKKWVIRSFVTISSEENVVGSVGNMELQFHEDRHVYILHYSPSIGDLFYNPDIMVLSMWSQENGWKIPQPHYDLVKNNKEFWKHFYDTLVVDSDYLDKLYGKRPQISEEEL